MITAHTTYISSSLLACSPVRQGRHQPRLYYRRTPNQQKKLPNKKNTSLSPQHPRSSETESPHVPTKGLHDTGRSAGWWLGCRATFSIVTNACPPYSIVSTSTAFAFASMHSILTAMPACAAPSKQYRMSLPKPGPAGQWRSHVSGLLSVWDQTGHA